MPLPPRRQSGGFAKILGPPMGVEKVWPMGHPELPEVVADRHSKWVAIPDRHDQQLRRRRYDAPNVGRGVSEEVLPRPARWFVKSATTCLGQNGQKADANRSTRTPRFRHTGPPAD